MKKKFYIYFAALALSCFGVSASAQFNVVPNPAINSDFSFFETDVVANSVITNTSEIPAVINWYRNIISLPQGWTTAVCDINFCYLDFVSSETFVLQGQAEGNIDVHVYPDGSAGSAMVELKLVSEDFPEDTTFVMYIFDAALNTTQRFEQKVKVFPNPTADMVWIEAGHDVQHVDVYSLDGKKVKHVALMGGESVSLSGLPQGTYVLRLRDRSGDLVSANVVVRQ